MCNGRSAKPVLFYTVDDYIRTPTVYCAFFIFMLLRHTSTNFGSFYHTQPTSYDNILIKTFHFK